ncbi:MAG: hypothetical protein A3F72_12240 [Bacteroidetes bacterium RIFCSPLOWO2_12_FULL_35_15]|nr:MAG: hypothetical protein A3F72_12240 [Bacteroidetes bacterium RIFCSPLOWO2_12_FULL_35_15]
MKSKLFIVLVFLGEILIGQEKVEKLKKQITTYTYLNHYDSAQTIVLDYLDQKELSPLEIFYGHFLFADILKSSNKPIEAIEKFKECKKYLDAIAENKNYLSLIDGDIAECYFNMSQYEDAKRYALLSLQTSPDSSLRGSGHAVNYMILGYANYISKNYSLALENYNNAMKRYNAYGASCELPLCYMKIAKVYNSMGNEKLAEENINKAISISDSCEIENYKLLSKRTLFDIYKENKNYEKALMQLEEINNLVAKLEYAKQGKVMSEMEVKYKTLLSQKEIENLKKINEANKKTLAEQERVLFIVIVAILILCVFLFFLVRISNQRKKAKQELELLNVSLEQKVIKRTKELAEDILVRRELEKQLSEKINEMETLISKLSHDLRSPLLSVLGLINVAENDPESDKSIYLDKIKESIKRLDHIIIDITNTIYVSTMEQNPEVIQFEKMINETIAVLQFRENFEKIKISILINQTKDFYSDPKFLQSIIQNLLENAVKYSNCLIEPCIEIVVQEDAKGVLLKITDNGTGISPEFHDKIFDMFFRGTEISKGTGLGLYIVKKAVEKLHGKIELQSEKGKGTIFTIHLPNLI